VAAGARDINQHQATTNWHTPRARVPALRPAGEPAARYLSVSPNLRPGDLIEHFHAGRSRVWFWNQVVAAITASAMNGVRRHWPEVSYALSTPLMAPLLWKAFLAARPNIPWQVLPWPLSQLIFEHAPAAVLPIAALPVLATALIVNRSFRWVSLFKTSMFGREPIRGS
jgi:hypothetical protein